MDTFSPFCFFFSFLILLFMPLVFSPGLKWAKGSPRFLKGINRDYVLFYDLIPSPLGCFPCVTSIMIENYTYSYTVPIYIEKKRKRCMTPTIYIPR